MGNLRLKRFPCGHLNADALGGCFRRARDARPRRLCEPTTAGPRRAVRREWPAASVEAAPLHGVLNQPLPARGFLLRALWRDPGFF